MWSIRNSELEASRKWSSGPVVSICIYGLRMEYGRWIRNGAADQPVIGKQVTMMKQKIVMCLLAGMLVLGMSGCGTQEVEVPEVENVENAENVEEEPAPEETEAEEEPEQSDSESAPEEAPTVDDAAESENTEPEEPEAASARWSMRTAARSPSIPPGLTRITRRSIPVRQCFIKLRRTEKKSW